MAIRFSICMISINKQSLFPEVVHYFLIILKHAGWIILGMHNNTNHVLWF